MTAENSNYNFDADVNRDGIINSQDVKLAKEDLGAIDRGQSGRLGEPRPGLQSGARRHDALQQRSFRGQCDAGRDLTFLDQASGYDHHDDGRSTGAYSITVPLVTGSNTFTVTTMDAFGQSITGAITPVVYSPSSPTDGSELTPTTTDSA